MSDTYDLGAIFDEHVADEFVAPDVDATMATMNTDPFVNHVPTTMGGVGRDGVRSFYGTYFIGHWPDDTVITPVSRTVGTDRVVDEMVICFTHDVAMPTFLPGAAPTARPVKLGLVVVMGFEADRVASSGSTGTRRRCWRRSGSSTRRYCRSPARCRPTRYSTRTCRPTTWCGASGAPSNVG